jgi:hypothetical protein
MSGNDDLSAHIKRMKAKQRDRVFVPDRRRLAEDDHDDHSMIMAILLPQLAFILGAIALIAGRSVAMNTFGIEPDTATLGWVEGIAVLLLLVLIGVVFGRANKLSHAALVIGASLSFLGERYYIPMFPDLMEQLYTPGYVALVQLGPQ